MGTERIDRNRIVGESLGQKFGKLAVLELIEYRLTPGRARVPIVKCRCECGEERTVSLWDLRSGKTKTCSLNHPHYEDRSMPAFNNIYEHSYKGRAIKAGLEFTLTREEFRAITQQDCHYCGAPPSGTSHRGVQKKRGVTVTGNHLSQYIYNGLDRKDSQQGYTMENVVPCCGVCNHAKHTMSYRDFIEWLDRVANFRKENK